MVETTTIAGVAVPPKARVALDHLRSACRAVVAAAMEAGQVPYGITLLRSCAPYVEALASYVENEGAGRIVEAVAAEEAETLGDTRFGVVQTGARNVARVGTELGHATGLRHRDMRVTVYHALGWVGLCSVPRLFDIDEIGRTVAAFVRKDPRVLAARPVRRGLSGLPVGVASKPAPGVTVSQSESVSNDGARVEMVVGIGKQPRQRQAVIAAPLEAVEAPVTDVPSSPEPAAAREPAEATVEMSVCVETPAVPLNALFAQSSEELAAAFQRARASAERV